MTARICVALIWPNDDGWRKALPHCEGVGGIFDDSVPPNATPGAVAYMQEKGLGMVRNQLRGAALKDEFWKMASTIRRDIVWELNKHDMRLMTLAMELVKQNQKAAAE